MVDTRPWPQKVLVRFYDPGQIDAQLDLATRSFLQQMTEVDAQGGVVWLSKILQWYGEDFGAGPWMKLGLGDRRVLVRAIEPYLAEDVRQVLANDTGGVLKIRLKEYDWGLNAM